MGKSKKLKHLKAMRSEPLGKQMEESSTARPSGRVKSRKPRADEDEQYVEEKLSKRILDEARKQQNDLEEEYDAKGGRRKEEKKKGPKKGTLFGLGSSRPGHEDSGESDDAESGEDVDETCYEEIKIDEADEKALEMFMSREGSQRKTLGDYISEKLKEKETEMETHFTDAGSVKYQELDQRVVDLYKGVKAVLSRYRHGKLPKAFKIIPALSNWEQVVEITEPDSWSAAAMFQASRIFSSNLKEKMAQRFYNLVLLPRVRDDIGEYKRLNFHLYQALKKAMFKPGAFFKGIILPLCESGDCTLREAVIVGSVLAKNHAPLLHGCAAMLMIAEMEYTGANSVFLHVLINKKYALPYRVIDAMVHHFLRFVNEKRQMPVLWHQCLLVFAEHYKEDLSSEQKEALLELLRVHPHHQITQVIRGHLVGSKCRDVEDLQEESQQSTDSGSNKT